MREVWAEAARLTSGGSIQFALLVTSINQTLTRLAGVAAALSCWSMAYVLARAWFTPMAIENGRWVSLGVGIMVMEFILVHAAGMLPGLLKSEKSPVKPLIYVSLLYVVFGVSIALAFKSRLLFGVFLAIMIPRWFGLFTGLGEAREPQLKRAGISAALYLLVAFLSVFVPFPQGGLNSAVLAEVYPNRGSGLWEKRPQQALAAGVIYFGVLGVAELILALRQSRASTAKPRDAAGPVVVEQP